MHYKEELTRFAQNLDENHKLSNKPSSRREDRPLRHYLYPKSPSSTSSQHVRQKFDQIDK